MSWQLTLPRYILAKYNWYWLFPQLFYVKKPFVHLAHGTERISWSLRLVKFRLLTGLIWSNEKSGWCTITMWLRTTVCYDHRTKFRYNSFNIFVIRVDGHAFPQAGCSMNVSQSLHFARDDSTAWAPAGGQVPPWKIRKKNWNTGHQWRVKNGFSEIRN